MSHAPLRASLFESRVSANGPLPRELLVLASPAAAYGGTITRLRALIARISPRFSVELRPVRTPSDMLAGVRGLRAGVVPVAAGGDGTANLLARAMWKEGLRETPCAVLPLGTGNAFAHALGVGRMGVALEALAAGSVRAVDLMVTSHPEAPAALVSISAGFEGRFIRALAREQTWRRAFAAAHALRAAFEAPDREVELILDGRRFVERGQRHYNAGLYNLPCYAFGAVVHPGADGQDGRAEAVVHASAGSYWRALGKRARWREASVWGTAGGARRRRSPRMTRWERAWFEAPDGLQVDGEHVGPGCFEIRVVRAALQWLVPAGAAPASPMVPA